MEPGHRRQISGQCFALARFKLPDEKVHGLLDELLCGVVLLCGALLVGRFARVAERRIFPVRRGVAAGAICVRHDVCSPLVPAWGGF